MNSKPVSIFNILEQTPSTSALSNNDAINVLLQEIKEFNVALCQEMDSVEQSSIRDTPLNTHTHVFPSHSSQLGSSHLNSSHTDVGNQIRYPLNLLDPKQDQGPLILTTAKPYPQESQQDMHQPQDMCHAPSLPTNPGSRKVQCGLS